MESTLLKILNLGIRDHLRLSELFSFKMSMNDSSISYLEFRITVYTILEHTIIYLYIIYIHIFNIL